MGPIVIVVSADSNLSRLVHFQDKLRRLSPSLVISGGAIGAEACAVTWACGEDIQTIVMPLAFGSGHSSERDSLMAQTAGLLGGLLGHQVVVLVYGERKPAFQRWIHPDWKVLRFPVTPISPAELADSLIDGGLFA